MEIVAGAKRLGAHSKQKPVSDAASDTAEIVMSGCRSGSASCAPLAEDEAGLEEKASEPEGARGKSAERSQA
jgi:hypothetical protein